MSKFDAVNITVTKRPFKYLVPSLHTKALVIFVFLLPQLVMLALSGSWSALIVILAAAAASVSSDCIRFIIQKKDITLFNIMYALIRGLLTGFFIPSSYPVPAVFVIVFFSVFLCGLFLDGFSDSWINPVAIAVSVCWILGMHIFPSWQISSELLLSRNPSLALIHNGAIPVLDIDPSITSFLNRTVFSLFGVSIPEGYVSLFWDTQSLIPAFRFNLITLVTSIFFIAFDVIKPMIPAVFTVVYGLLVYIAGPLFFGGRLFQGDIILAFFTSGVIFLTLFLIQWPGTIPFTVSGKFVYAVTAGILAFMIIGAGTSPSGAVFTVLSVNVVSIIIQAVEQYAEKKQTISVLAERVKSLKEGNDA